MKDKMVQYDFLLDTRSTHKLNLINQSDHPLKITKVRITSNAEITTPWGPIGDRWGKIKPSKTPDDLHYIYEVEFSDNPIVLSPQQSLEALKYSVNGALGPIKDSNGGVAMPPIKVELAINDKHASNLPQSRGLFARLKNFFFGGVEKKKLDDAELQVVALKDSEISPPDPHSQFSQNYYFANWGQYTTKKTADNVHYGDNNCLTYAFIGFDPSTGKVESLDSWGDMLELPKLNLAKQRFHYLKLNLAFGGWTNKGMRMDTVFAQMARDANARHNFVKNAVDAVIQAGGTGIDIDWEYVKKEDAENFVLLMQELRAELNKRIPNAQLTIAAPAGKDNIECLSRDQWQKVAAAVNVISIMTYDYFGSFSNYTDFHSAWKLDPNSPYAKAEGEAPYFCIEKTLSLYHNLGIEAKKLAIGIPNYCRGVIVDNLGPYNGLYQPVQGAPMGEGGSEGGIYSWDAILKKLRNQPSPLDQLNVQQWYFYGPEHSLCKEADMCLLVGQLPDNRWAVFNFLDPNCAYRRALFAAENGYAGAMVWANYNDTTNHDDSFAKAISCGLEKQHYHFLSKDKLPTAYHAQQVSTDDRDKLIGKINEHIDDLEQIEKRNTIAYKVFKFVSGLVPAKGILTPVKKLLEVGLKKLLGLDIIDKNHEKIAALKQIKDCHMKEDVEKIINQSRSALNQHRNPIKRLLMAILPSKWTHAKRWFHTESLRLAKSLSKNIPKEHKQVVDMEEIHTPYEPYYPMHNSAPMMAVTPAVPAEPMWIKEVNPYSPPAYEQRFFPKPNQNRGQQITEGPHHELVQQISRR